MLKQSQLIKADRRTLNSYDTIYNMVSKKPLFNQEDWVAAANGGNLDIYTKALMESDKINPLEYNKKYNLDYADSKTRMMALFNETGADTTNVDTKRKKTVIDADGTTREEEYLASDYEYNLGLIRAQNDYNQQIRQREIAQDIKASMTAGDHILSVINAPRLSIWEGVMRGVDNITALLGGVGSAIVNEKGDVLDSFVAGVASDDFRPFAGLTQDLIDFETNYTSMRDVDGNYTTWGKYVGGVMTSLGEMLPSMLIGMGVGKALGTAGGAIGNVAGKIGSGVSQGTFYAAMGAGNVQDMYTQYTATGADIDSSAILANAAIKSGMQWFVEYGLGKVLGSTSLDNMVFGRQMTAGTGKSLTAAGIKTIFKDALQEGLEEVFQDTSDFLVDKGFEMFIKEFKGTSDISWQSLIDAFIIGGISSFAGSARNIITAKNVYANDKKLNKLASWQYGLNMQSFAESLNEIDKAMHHTDRYGQIGPKKFELSDKDRSAIQTATVEAYAAYRMITSIYSEIGEERFKAANDVLDKITDKIKTGIFEIEDVNQYVSSLQNQLKSIATEKIKKTIEKAASDLEKDGVTEIKDTVEKSDKKSQSQTNKTAAVADALGTDVVVTDGDTFTEVDGVTFISENKLTKSVGELMKSKAVNDLVKTLHSNFGNTPVYKRLSETFNKYYGHDAEGSELALALFYDKSFFSSTLLDGNKDVYKFLSYFVEFGKRLKDNVPLQRIQKVGINTILKNWVESLTEYCIIHSQADPSLFLYAVENSEKRKSIEDRIKRERWSSDIYNRVVTKGLDALTDSEQKTLKNRFDKVFDNNQAEHYWNNLSSDRPTVRQAAMNVLSKKYSDIFNSDYDGKTYMPDISVGNRVFNRFLKSANLTLKTFLNNDGMNVQDVINLRHEQFRLFTHDAYDFEVKNKSLQILYKGEIVGYTDFDKVRESVETGELSESFVGETEGRNKKLASLLKNSLGIAKNYFIIDDVITDPDLLNEDVQNAIKKFAKERYGQNISFVDSQYAMLYLRDYFIKVFKTITIVLKQDGTYAFADVSKVEDCFVNPTVKVTKNSKLTDIFKKDKIPQGLKLVVVPNSSDASFIPYKTSKVGADTVTLVDNTIYIGENLFNENDAYVRFAIAHEFQHAVEFANNINFGMDFQWLNKIDPKQQKEIIADVRKHKPELFNNIEKGSVQEFNIVQDYVYHSSGEYTAYGLEGNPIIDFVPVLSQNDNNVLTITFPWNSTYTIKNVEKADVISSIWKKTADNLWQFTELKDLYSGINENPKIDDWRVQHNVTVYTQELSIKNLLKNKEYSDFYEELRKTQGKSPNIRNFNIWLHKSPYMESGVYKQFKKDLKESLTVEDKMVSLKILHTRIAPDMEFDEFLNTDVNFVRMQENEYLGDSEFVSIYAGATNQSVQYCIDGLVGLPQYEDTIENMNLIVGTFKPKDALIYFATSQSEILIEPDKLINAKIFKCANSIVDNHVDIKIIDSNGRQITYEETHTSLADLDRQFKMSLKTNSSEIRPPNKNELREDDPRAKNFRRGEKSSHGTYLARYYVIDDKGNQVLKRNGFPRYHYVYPDEKTKTRKVGQRKWKGTKLEPFAKKYQVTQMSKEFQNFILNAEGLDPVLQDKIDGKLKGTLTQEEVMSYFRSKDRIDDVTFKAINDAFFKNEYIDSLKELEDIALVSPDAWVLWRVAKRTPALREYLDDLHDREMSLELFRDIALKDEKANTLYKNFTYEFTNLITKNGARDLEIPEHYFRIALMRHYDGSIKSMRDAASAARISSLSKTWNITPKDSRWNEIMTEAYEEATDLLDDLSDEDIVQTLLTRKAAELKNEYKNDYNKYKEESLKYYSEIQYLSRSELIKLYNGRSELNKVLVEGVVVDALGQYVSVNVDAVPTSRTYVDRMKGAVSTIKSKLTGKEQAALAKKYSNIFNKDLTVKKELYKVGPNPHDRYKDVDEVIKIFEKVNDIKNDVLLHSRSTAEELRLERKLHRISQREINRLKKGVKSDGKTPHVVEIVTDDSVEQLAVEKEMPLPLLKMLQVHYNKTAKTSVQNLSSENDRHKKRVANDFYSNADEILLNLTQGDVDEIIDFFVNGIVNLNDATAPYQVAEMLIMTYLIEVGRTGVVKLRGKKSINNTPSPVNFVISESQLAKLEDLLEKRISRPATVLSTWRHVLHQLDPVQTIQQSIARKAGVKPTDEEIRQLLDAVSSGDIKQVEATKKKVYEAMIARNVKNYPKGIKKLLDKNWQDDILDKILQYERLAMLSGPGTWVRNAVSNTVVKGVNWTADKLIPGMDSILYKLFPKNKTVENQYQMAGTKVDEDVAKYIDAKLKKNGLLDLAIDGISKYDPRKSVENTLDETVLTEMLTRATIGVANSKNQSKIAKFISKRISDDPWVKKATLSYLGKMITEDLVNSENAKIQNEKIKAYNAEIRKANKNKPKKEWESQLKEYKEVRIDNRTEFFSETNLNRNFLVYVAEAYKLAAYDYMHRNNILLSFESKLAQKNYKAYVAYKQVFPFAGVGWNWFVEGLNYTPVGLAKAIVNFAKLENTVEKMEEARRQFKHGEVGPSSDFASYIAKRNITKGLIGSIGFVAGILLAALGVVRLDDEDDRYKLIIGEVGVDVSELFGTQGIFFGMAIAGGIRNEDSAGDVFVAALDQMFMDSTFSDVFNTFRYNETFGEFIAYQPYALLNMMIPNFLKTVASIANPQQIVFSDGILGKIQRLGANALPGLSYALPHYYDPYTGEKQVPWVLGFVTKFVDKLSPLGLSIYHVSDLERNAIAHGINKTQLTGKYTINGESVKVKYGDIDKLNRYYGQLNVADFKELQSNRVVYKIQQKDGRYKNVKWSQMTDKEKAAVVDRITTNNSGYAKIYILTDSNNYKYYASASEYKELKSLGITKNVYKASGDKRGFVKIN